MQQWFGRSHPFDACAGLQRFGGSSSRPAGCSIGQMTGVAPGYSHMPATVASMGAVAANLSKFKLVAGMSYAECQHHPGDARYKAICTNQACAKQRTACCLLHFCGLILMLG